jgi:alpha-glucosidase
LFEGGDPSIRTASAAWWKQAVIYEVALISFQDSGGDGKGDLRGLISRLDHLTWLGVDAVWLTPIHISPMRDLGYDIGDFCAIDPVFGTMEDFDRLVGALHGRGLRLVLDFVPNHTSDTHPWFRESRASRDNPKQDWYVWADPDDNGGPPNNWLSRFGGSAWQWEPSRRQFYYHSFLAEQPDLDWRNPAVRDAMAQVLRFWMARGVDGFRVDASAVLIEDDLLRDDPPAPDYDEARPPPQRLQRVFTDDRPESMDCLEGLRAVVDEYDGRLLAGEVQGKIDRIGHFYGGARPRLHLPLNFALLDSPWDALSLQAHIDAYFNAIPADAWPDWVIGGHDKKRIAGRIGQAQARILAMLVMTLRGTPFIYMGDEIGMEDVAIAPERVQDPFEKRVSGYGLGRDPQRTPMRWTGEAKAGFTTGEPWLPVGADVGLRNVERMRADEHSILWLYRALIALRRSEPALTRGDHVPMRATHDVLCFGRRHGRTVLIIALNISHEPRRWKLDGAGRVLLSTRLEGGSEPVEGSLLLREDEGVVIKLDDG